MAGESKDRSDPPWLWPAAATLLAVWLLMLVYGSYHAGYYDGLAQLCRPSLSAEDSHD